MKEGFFIFCERKNGSVQQSSQIGSLSWLILTSIQLGCGLRTAGNQAVTTQDLCGKEIFLRDEGRHGKMSSEKLQIFKICLNFEAQQYQYLLVQGL